MSHPTTRAERRYHRDRIITKRRFIYLHIWIQMHNYQFMREVSNPLINIMLVFEKWKNSYKTYEYPEWGRYNKWNLNCTCWRCHYNKFDKSKAKRRHKLKTADSDWELQYNEE
jgi:5-methylcytosine-specific restriction endonuclease McrA